VKKQFKTNTNHYFEVINLYLLEIVKKQFFKKGVRAGFEPWIPPLAAENPTTELVTESCLSAGARAI
jgi:hypothetical protein